MILNTRINRENAPYLAMLVILGAGLIVNVLSLEHYPVPHCDEGHLAHVSYNFLTSGEFRVDFTGESFQHLWVARIASMLQALYMAVFGVNLMANRLLAWTGFVIMLGFVYLVGQKLYGRTSGLLAALAAASSLNVFWASHLARRDIWMVAVSVGLLYLWLVVRDKKEARYYALLGAMAILPLEFHPNAVWFSLPIGLFVLFENWRTGEGRRLIAVCAGTAFLVVAALLAWHLLPDPQAAFTKATTGNWAANNDLWAGTLLDRLFGQIDFVMHNYTRTFNGYSVIFYAFGAVSLLYALFQREKADLPVLAAFGLSFVAFTFGQGHKSVLYAPYWDAYIAVLIGGAAVRISPRITERLGWAAPAWASFALILPLIGPNFAAQAWLGWKAQPRDYARHMENLREYIPPDAVVFGDTELWFGFYGQRFLSNGYSFWQLAADEEEPSAEEMVEWAISHGATHIIDDGTRACRNTSNPADAAFSAYLAQTCTEVGRVEDRHFGADAVFGVENAQPTLIFTCTVPFGENQ